ncbi:hypothetical protein VHEMI05562 [[Torrubiella] hemipterigena]|uniref:Uncharacterized protein n=1 Tax=[Torrubiella] hemipterigena TaxID=1531966 RepID=A0A0A1TJ37_9HYPO|nr:hypothetical protein VHEMI05562 [[Torrubiella] hemipterigena]
MTPPSICCIFLSTNSSMSLLRSLYYGAILLLAVNLLIVNAMAISPDAQDGTRVDADKDTVQGKLSAHEVEKKFSYLRPSFLTRRRLMNHEIGNDDDPMVYETPYDYAADARQQRDWLLSLGADPNTMVLQSEIKNHVPPRDNEPDAEYAAHYLTTMKDMIKRDVMILNDQSTGDSVATGFWLPDGRHFDLGPESGVTKGEFKAFGQWWIGVYDVEGEIEVPERCLKFETVDEDGEES